MKNYREIFGKIDTTSYKEAAGRFLPHKIKRLFIFESPPFGPPIHPITKKTNSDWSYFYRHETDGSDNLRRIICSTLFDEKMMNAKGFLEKFCTQGYFLVDAVNYPIDDIISEHKHMVKLYKGKVHSDEREKIVFCEAEELVNTIKYWVEESKSNLLDIKMIVIKAPVFRGLFTNDNKFKEKVDTGEFQVLNDYKIDYPLFNINTFKAEVRKLLKLSF